jgi:hypothetical protein
VGQLKAWFRLLISFGGVFCFKKCECDINV